LASRFLPRSLYKGRRDKAMFAPLYELAFVNGVGPRVDESGLGHRRLRVLRPL